MSKLTWVTKSNIFNENNFDENIAKITASIHYNVETNKETLKFNKWAKVNKEHLEVMYVLSRLDCGFDMFSDYIYMHS